MLDQTLMLVTFLSLFYSCSTLLCTTNCSFTASITTPFNIPNHCNQSIQAGKCLGEVVFWFNFEKYNVNLQADSSNSIKAEDNKLYVLLDLSPYISGHFSYSIGRACKNQDDCARDLIADMVPEILQRRYNYSAIRTELQPLISDSILTSHDYHRQCYDSKHNVHQCGASSTTASCVIINKISQKKISLQCDTEIFPGDIHVSIYQEIYDDYASFNIHCSESLCNTRLTLQAVKKLIYRHGVTVTPDGRLDGSRLIQSTLLIIVMMLFLFFY